MVREERDPAFWLEVASHPAVSAAVTLDHPFLANAVGSEGVLPLASANGGYLLSDFDQLGTVRGLHALYVPAGWGREAHAALKEALEWAFAVSQVVLVHETERNPNSRAPVSFGFVPAGDWQDTAIGKLRVMVLTRAAWECSPARKRLQRPN